jgi:DNA-binding HxlR family transcriptional regulator
LTGWPNSLKEPITLVSADVFAALNAGEVVIDPGLKVAAAARTPLKNKHFKSPLASAAESFPPLIWLLIVSDYSHISYHLSSNLRSVRMEVMSNDAGAAFCPYFHHAVELIGRRWTGAIVRALLSGARRFSEVSGAIPGLSDRMLSERLRELECEGIVQRLVRDEKPVRVDYLLTEKGRALGQVVEAISVWAEDWVSNLTDPGGVWSGRPVENSAVPERPEAAVRR